MIPLPRRAVAEAIGTFLFCFVGVAAICQKWPGPMAGLIGIALAHGLALSVASSALGKVSGGHFNPAVSFTMAVTHHLAWRDCLVYVLSQLAGATVAGFAVKATFSSNIYAVTGGGVPVPSVLVGQAIVLEAIATFFLLIAYFGTAVDARAPSIGGFGIGLTVAFDTLAIWPQTGASMNPARSFGPALAAGIWEDHLVYWIGPIVGGVLAGVIYTQLFLSPVPPERPPGSGID